MSSKKDDFFSNLFGNFSKEINKVGQEVSSMFSSSELGTTVPAINIVETRNDFELYLAAPGLTKQDFKLGVDGNVLTISARVDQPEKNYVKREFDYSRFKREFEIDESVDKDMITASYKDGILLVTLPKKESMRRAPEQNIEIW